MEKSDDTAVAVHNDGARKSGLKRKVYVLKATLTPASTSALALVPGKGAMPPTNLEADEEAVSETDSNKKHKMDGPTTSSGSADQAAAAGQPRQTQ